MGRISPAYLSFVCYQQIYYNYSGKSLALFKKHKLAGIVLCRERVLKDATKDLLDTLDKYSSQMWEVLKVINHNEAKQLFKFSSLFCHSLYKLLQFFACVLS